MDNLNFISVASFALKNHCSFFGGRPAVSVNKGLLGEMVFLFKPQHYGNSFFQWIRINSDSSNYFEKVLIWHGIKYYALFLKVPQKVNKKFLLSFRAFAKSCPHLVNYF